MAKAKTVAVQRVAFIGAPRCGGNGNENDACARKKTMACGEVGCVRDAPYACARICASTQANALMLTMRRTVDAGVTTCTGFDTPINIGPIATPSVSWRTKL